MDKKRAVVETVSAVTVSVLTSGSVMAVVGFLLGYISTHGIISQPVSYTHLANQSALDSFFYKGLNAVPLSDPGRSVSCLSLLCHALVFCHSLNQAAVYFLRPLIIVGPFHPC